MAKTYRVGIVGLDHWYAALAAAESATKNPRTELVAIAHRDARQLAETAARYGVGATSTKYEEVLDRDDLDIIVTGVYCSENPDVVVAAAQKGRQIVSTKPVAMDNAGSDKIVAAVQKAGVKFISNEATYLVSPAFIKIKQWIDEGKIGKPISAYSCLRSPVPRQPWPGERGDTWWLDATKSPGGGWIDHSIYHISALRWIFGSDVVTSTGVVANLREKNLPFEDFGVANLVFEKGQVAISEVTWTGLRDASYNTFQVVGTEGQIVWDQTTSGKIAAVGNFGVSGWFQVSPGPSASSVLDHLVDTLDSGKALVSNEIDARANLAACLDFYAVATKG